MKRSLTWALSVLILLSVSRLLRADSAAKPLDADGIVTDELGKPIAGATVDLIRQNYQKSPWKFIGVDVLATTSTDDQGKYHLSVPLPDEKTWHFLIRAVAPGRGYSANSINLKAAAESRYADGLRQSFSPQAWIILAPARTVSGIVVDEHGNPIGDCEVISEGIRDPIRTGPDGKFGFESVSDFHDSMLHNLERFEFDHPDFVHQTVTVAAPARSNVQADRSWRVEMQRGVVVSGLLSDEAKSQPLPRAGVRAWAFTVGFNEFEQQAFADEHGRYSLRVPANLEVSLNPSIADDDSQRDYAPKVSDLRRTFPAGVDQTDVDFTFVKGQHISGTLKLSSPGDASGIHVALQPASGTRQRIAGDQCKQDGTFDLRAIPPGSYELVASSVRNHLVMADLTATPVEVADGQDTTGVEIQVEADQSPAAQPTLHGKVLNADGTPAVLAALRATSDRIGQYRREPETFTDLEGNFTLHDIDPDAASTIWVCDSTRATAWTIELPAGSDLSTPLEIKLVPTSQITGRVYDDEDKPLEDVRVELGGKYPNMTRGYISTRTNAKGEYVLRGFVPPAQNGNLVVMVFTEQRPHQSVSFVTQDASSVKASQTISGLNFRVAESDQRVQITAEHE